MASAGQRPFRFAVGAPLQLSSRHELVDHVHRAEANGYSVVTFPDHLFIPLAPLVALTVAAEATSTVRLATLLLANDLRHPAMLAKEVATLDLISDGRVEVGLGAGWLKADYDAIGLEFDHPRVRIARLAEAAQVLRGAFGTDNFSFVGEFYRITDLTIRPRPVQPGGPPLMMGGGMRRILTVAARHADTVTIAAQAMGAAATTALAARARLEERARWVTEASAGRDRPPERHLLLSGVAVGRDRRAAARECLRTLASSLGGLGPSVDEDTLLDSPFYAVGPVDHIVEQLVELRETVGVSYVSVMAPFGDAFSPIVSALTGR